MQFSSSLFAGRVLCTALSLRPPIAYSVQVLGSATVSSECDWRWPEGSGASHVRICYRISLIHLLFRLPARYICGLRWALGLPLPRLGSLCSGAQLKLRPALQPFREQPRSCRASRVSSRRSFRRRWRAAASLLTQTRCAACRCTCSCGPAACTLVQTVYFDSACATTSDTPETLATLSCLLRSHSLRSSRHHWHDDCDSNALLPAALVLPSWECNLLARRRIILCSVACHHSC